MKRALSRAAALAVAAPVLLAAGTAAHAVTVPGCYGGGTNATVVCNLTITVDSPVGVELYDTTVPVCAGTCQQVPVTLVRTTPGDPVAVCYTYKNGAGQTISDCLLTQQEIDDAVELLLDVAQLVGERVQEILDDPMAPVCARTTAC